jgi:hypothetical protein
MATADAAGSQPHPERKMAFESNRKKRFPSTACRRKKPDN